MVKVVTLDTILHAVKEQHGMNLLKPVTTKIQLLDVKVKVQVLHHPALQLVVVLQKVRRQAQQQVQQPVQQHNQQPVQQHNHHPVHHQVRPVLQHQQRLLLQQVLHPLHHLRHQIKGVQHLLLRVVHVKGKASLETPMIAINSTDA